MCGIAGVYLRRENANAFNVVKQILCGQESRGVSSTGVAYLRNGAIQIDKDTVSPSQFAKREIESGHIVIGHNRMPSVSEVSIVNAHPFRSCDGKFSLLHNGTERTEAIRMILQNHNIEGGTDSEVICHFLEELCKYYPMEVALGKIGETNKWSSFLVITKEGRSFGVGDNVKIINDENGIYIASEEDSFNKMFKKQKKTVISPNGVFELSGGKLKFYGKESKEEITIGKKKDTGYINQFIAVIEEDFDDEDDEEAGLFVRQRRHQDGRTVPYTFLGPADQVSHRGEQLISFVWRLRRPMPAGFFREARVATG